MRLLLYDDDDDDDALKGFLLLKMERRMYKGKWKAKAVNYPTGTCTLPLTY
jgi:hypothetical protein